MAQARTAETGLSPDVPIYREVLRFQILEGNERQLRAEIEESDSMILARDENGLTILHLAAARVLDSVTDIVERYEASEAVVMLSEKTRDQGWTSLHISTIRNDTAIVEYILSKLDDEEEKQAFIDEVDRELGWTSLQWGAALDNVEAVETMMDSMSISHQQEVMTSGWTLLHATAKTDAVNTMRSLMNRFETTEEKNWKILTCPTANGKTALHIAVAEGNARAAIMLLDLAGTRKSQLGAQPDQSGQSPVSYANEFSLLGEYLSLSVEFQEPAIHMAAKRNDRLLVSWILDQYSCPMSQVINQRNEDESTVLHAASEGNSPEVIKEIALKLGQEDFFDSIHEVDKDGRSVLHNSIVKNCPSSTNAILSSVSNNESRRSLLQLENGQGENATALAENLGQKQMNDIIRYHRMILDYDVEKFLTGFEYSLFSVEIPPDCLKARYERLEPRESEIDRGFVRNANSDATTCILFGNTQRAEKLIAAAVKVDDLNIHTWCNKGVLCLKQNRVDEAESAAFRVLELMASESVYSQLLPRINYAYWTAEVLRTENAWNESSEILQQCEEPASKDPAVHQFLSYCFLKVLVRHLKESRDWSEEASHSWYRQTIAKAVEQMLVLYKSGNDEYLADMWVWLLELQNTKIPPEYSQKPLEKFKRETDIDNIDRQFCHKQAKAFNSKNTKDRKRKARMAKNCLSVAYGCDDTEQACSWYNEAVEMSEQWIEENYWTLLCASTSSQGLINIWGMEFYDERRKLVQDQYRQMFGRDLRSPIKASKFISEDFCYPNVTTSDKLQRVKGHLQRITERESSWLTHGAKYARVMCLLGEDSASIENAFNKAIEACDSGYRKARALEHFGCYYVATGNRDKAGDYLQLAVTTGLSSPKMYKAWKAINLLKLIYGIRIRF